VYGKAAIELHARGYEVVNESNGFWIKPSKIVDNTAMILYVHGGCYGFRDGSQYEFPAKILPFVGLPVFSIMYRVPAVLPNVIDEIVSCYKSLVDKGFKVILAGYSSGAHAVLNLCLKICELNYSKPIGVVVLSPWAVISLERADFGDSMRSNESKDHICWSVQVKYAKMCMKGCSRVIASPLLADERVFRQLSCPLFLCYGESEVLRDTSASLALHLEAADIALIKRTHVGHHADIFKPSTRSRASVSHAWQSIVSFLQVLSLRNESSLPRAHQHQRNARTY